MNTLVIRSLIGVAMLVTTCCLAEANETEQVLDIWPDLAPGETTRETGTTLPRRESENPPATRIGGITCPRLQVFLPAEEKRSGAAVLIFPGGGYNYVVSDKEGSEAARWLNDLGIAAFVVHYRTKEATPGAQSDPLLPPLSERPLQDGQRALSLVRHRSAQWKIKPDRIGVLGFSAGGQAACLVTTRFEQRAYAPVDEIDKVSCRPDFALLVYPWRLVDDKTGQLGDAIVLSKETPTTFLLHTHDDSATSLSSVLMYAGLKKLGVGAELHIYETGGHGYGMRPVENSDVDTWPARATDWLRRNRLIVR